MAIEPSSGGNPGALEALRGRVASLEAAAAAATARLSLVIESLPDGFVLYDGDDRLVICNARYRDIYALSAPAIVEGARFEDILRYGLQRGQYAVIKGQEEAWLEARLAIHANHYLSFEQQLGDGRWLQVIEQPAPDGGRVGVRIDITARKRQDRRLADIIAGTNVGTWEWNVQTGETIISERWAEILGTSVAALAPVTDQTWLELCHPDDLNAAYAAMDRHFRGDADFFDLELRMRHRDGHWVWVQSRGRVASWTAAGAPEWFSGTTQDISQRKHQEAATIAAKNQLAATLAAIPDLIFELDSDGRFIDCHVGDVSMLYAPPEMFIGKTIPEVLPPEVAATCQAAIDEACAKGQSNGRQYQLATPDGPRWFELTVARIVTNGNPSASPSRSRSDHVPDSVPDDVPSSGKSRVIVLARNITKRQELENKLAAERNFLDQIMATSLSAIVVIDADGALSFANKAAERVLGVAAPTAVGRRFDNPAWRVTAVDGGPYPIEELPFAQVMRNRAPVFDVRHAIEWPDGTRRILSVNAAPLVEAAGAPRRVVCSVTDITDQLAAEARLRDNEFLLRGLFELSPVGIALTDFETGAFIDVNDAILAPSGFTREELLGMSYFDLTPEEHLTAEEAFYAQLTATGRYGPFEKENFRKDGSRFPVLLRGMMVTDFTGRRLIWSIVEDITERKAAERQNFHKAHYDDLTGLPNRRLFQERLERALARARRGRQVGAIAMLDLDDFKTVNDSYGHRAGDAILVEAANRLTACIRATDTVARFGGDEFLVLLEDIAAPGDAGLVAEKMHTALARPYSFEGRMLQLGVSIGICLFPADGDDLDQLIQLADMAMYRAKHEGRNLTRFYGPADHPSPAPPALGYGASPPTDRRPGD